MKINFSHLIQYFPKYIEGLELTIQIAAISLVAAFLLGCVIVLLGMVKNRVVTALVKFYISFFRGVPILVQFFLIHYAIPGITNHVIVLSAVQSGCVTFSLNSAAYLAESIRGGINGVDSGQYEAAKALGISHAKVMLYIVVPQALRVVFPSLINSSITLIKDSAIVSQIGAFDLTRSAYYVSARTYNSMEAFTFSAIFYLAIILTLTFAAKLIEKQMNRSVSMT